jgi:hypothetical protein
VCEAADVSSPLVAVVCGDAGGAAAIAPVIDMLRSEGRVSVRPLAYRQAGECWTPRLFPFERLDDQLTIADARGLLGQPRAALLLWGTSVNGAMLEHTFLEAAREVGIPSLGLLDAWVNYVERFSAGARRLDCVPDRIAVMDESARMEMVREGFDPALLTVTGQPAFDSLNEWRTNFTDARRQDLRARWGVEERELAVLFASQPMHELYGHDGEDPRHFGYDERSVISVLVSTLDEIAAESNRSIVLILRPHPREDDGWLRAVRSARIRVAVSREGDARDAALAADVVTGMSSALLLEACYLHCLVVSVQPNLRRPDVLPTNRAGLSHPVYRAGDAKGILKALLLDEKAQAAARERLRALTPVGGAASRVVELVYEMLGAAGSG